MRFLEFERRYQLESEPCPRCNGDGIYGSVAQRMSRQCYNCRGLGRKISRAGRELFKAICLELGHPVSIKDSRIDPKHIDQVYGRELKVGMCVGQLYPQKLPRKVITAIEWLQLGQARVTFEESSVAVFGAIDSLARELTPAELDRVEHLMAARVGAGAVAA
jgi:hypothetical protein